MDAEQAGRGYRGRMGRARHWWHYPVGVLVAAYFLAGIIGSAVAAAQARGWAAVVLIVGLHLFAIGCCAYVIIRRKYAFGLLLAATAAALAAQLLTPYSGIGLVYLVAWTVPSRLRLWPGAVILTLLGAGFLGASLLSGLSLGTTSGISAGLGWAVLLAALVHQLSVTRGQSAAMAQARSREAVLAERQRLAREIHDLLAHALSAQVVHLEGTRMLLERGCDQAVALERVVRAGDLARAGLDETKRALAALRGSQAPLADQLELLAVEFRSVTGNPCTLVVDEAPEPAAETQLAVVRTTQEALTNVHKHAPHAEVTVVLRRPTGWCELEVRDTGSHAGALSDAGSGYGLVGMRERAELLGGHLEAGPDGPGFRVRLRVPA